MRAKILILFSFIILQFHQARSQEFQANVTVLSNRICTRLTNRFFPTLQSALYNFMNGRKWTNVAFNKTKKSSAIFY